MAIDTTSPRTRRAILLGALGGAVASAAAAVGRANPVSAADDQAVVVGGEYTASSVTKFDTQTTGASALSGSSDYSAGVAGESVSGWGVSGLTSTGIAIKGTGQGGLGVYGDSESYIGIYGYSNSTDHPALLTFSQGNSTAVQGYSGADAPPAAPAKTGVYGYAAQSAAARGVTGQTKAGRGVNGIATNGTGVYGRSTSGEGMRGTSVGSNGTAGTSASPYASGVYGENTAGGYGTYGRSNTGAGYGVFGESASGTGVTGNSNSGVGVWAVSTGPGIALKAEGRVSFSMAGLADVAVGKAARTIKPSSDLNAGSLILCTLESGQPHLAIQRVTKNTTAKNFTVYLSEAVAAGQTAKVGWFVIG